MRYVELINPPKENDKTSEQIIDGIRGKLKSMGESNHEFVQPSS